jgi:hypothetical protein
VLVWHRESVLTRVTARFTFVTLDSLPLHLLHRFVQLSNDEGCGNASDAD